MLITAIFPESVKSDKIVFKLFVKKPKNFVFLKSIIPKIINDNLRASKEQIFFVYL